MAVQTRAQKAKEEEIRAQEDRQTEEAGIALTPLQEEAVDSVSDHTEDEEEEDGEDAPTHQLEETEDDDPLPQDYPHTNPSIPYMPLGAEAFAKAQEDDPGLTPLWDLARTSPGRYKVKEGLLFRVVVDELDQPKDLLVVPKALSRIVWEQAHSSPLAGHVGHKKIRQKLARHFFWERMSQDCKSWTTTCPVCQRGNTARRAKAPLHPVPVITQPWKKIAMDVVQPLSGLTRTTKGNRFILTIMDQGSRYPEAFALRRVTAADIARCLTELFARFGLPEEILSDNGPNLTSKLIEELLASLKISHIKTTPYRPQSNGMLERWHRDLKRMLSKLSTGDRRRWDEWLPYVLFAARDTPHSATGFTPFELLFGREVRGPSAALHQAWTAKKTLPASVVSYMMETQERLQTMTDTAKKREQETRKKTKSYYDRTAREDPLEEGDQVLALLPAGPRGISASWEGPFTVLQKKSDLTYKVSARRGHGVGRVFHRNLLKRWIQPVDRVAVVVADATQGADQLHLEELPPPKPTLTYQDWRTQVLDQADITDPQKKQLASLLDQHQKTFSDDPGLTTEIEFVINTGDSPPVSTAPREPPKKWKQQHDLSIEDLLRKGILEDSTSPWASATHCVGKGQGEVRVVVDTRAVNNRTIPDPYPLPRLEQVLDEVANSHFISTLDLNSGYYQIPVRLEDRPKTAIITHQGKYRFTRMPFGFKHASSG